MNTLKTLIVGTTNDYIDLIHNRFGDDVLFITDVKEKELRDGAFPFYQEIVSDLAEEQTVLRDLEVFLLEHQIQLNGIASFDCESLALAAFIARKYSLKYPPLESVRRAGNKLETKKLLKRSGIRTPYSNIVNSVELLVAETGKINSKTVLKPLYGSGSELVFSCETLDESIASYDKIIQGLDVRKGSRLFTREPEYEQSVVIEEYIDGTEYSCDFINNERGVSIIRLTEKIKSKKNPFGTVSGYRIISEIPGVSDRVFRKLLADCSESLQLTDVICMVDLIVNNGEAYILEITPRPGGDCLPQLIFHASGIDIIEANILNSSGKGFHITDLKNFRKLTAFKLFADGPGILKNIDMSSFKNDPDLVFFECKQKLGSNIKFPPEDYDSWYLGYVIINDIPGINDKMQQIMVKAGIEIEK